MSAWRWLLVTETGSKLYIIVYDVVFWLNDIVVSTTTQRGGSYQILTSLSQKKIGEINHDIARD
jgi:hypothetical protein